MITHHLLNKRVSWNTLEKIRLGKNVEYVRKMNFGVVRDVTSCGGLCLVIDDNEEKHEIETAELDPLDQDQL